jgi:two-component system, NtrC family, response regulator GlrR
MSDARDDARKVLALRGLGIVFVHPDPSPRFVPLGANPLVLGRNPDCDVPLDGRAVSWEHAEIAPSGRTAVIRDLQSTNGVMVDGARVHEAELDEGSLIRLGDFLGVVARIPTAAGGRESLEADAAAVGMYLGPVLEAAIEPLVVARGESLPIVIEGETGTGKTLAARLIHAQERRRGPFVALDCGAVDPTETNRLLFGDTATRGALEQSVAGTVYLGSIAALEPSLQERLARTIAEGRWERLGLVIGSQEPLATALADGRLSGGLYKQLDGVKIRLPPLRRRVVEIPALFRHLYRRHGRGVVPPLSTEMVERLCLYDWPCNVREMVLLLLRLISLHGEEERLRSAHLPPRMLPADLDNRTTSPVLPQSSGLDVPLVLDAVREAGGNMTRAADRLGISRERAYRLLDRIGLSAGRP